MTDGKLIVICKDKKMGDDICKILVASEKISYADLEVWEEKTWDVKRKTGPINSRVLIVGDIKDTEPLSCFIDILYERWGICYGVNMRYAIVKADTVFVKHNARNNAFMPEFNEALGTNIPDRIMLDNLTPEKTKEAVNIIREWEKTAGRHMEIESSGGITIETIRSYAEQGMDFVSVGALTHSYKSLDMSFKAVK